jgi:hypothetical protein
MLTRMFWADFVIHRETKFESLEDYTTYRVRNDWHMSMEEAQKKVITLIEQNLVPYDRAQFGDLPEILKNQ